MLQQKIEMAKVIIDKDIPFIKGILEPYTDVIYFLGKNITREVILDTDAMVIRTRTKCNRDILSGSRVKAIFSATIGTDHIDMAYCKANDIAVYSAPGCNAWGVVQYVITSLYCLAEQRDMEIDGKVLGIIGVGNVGERLAWLAERLGFRVMRCDPPEKERLMKDSNRAALRGLDIDTSSLTYADYYDLDEVLEYADIISIHLPLNEDTRSFCSEQFFRKMRKGTILINSSRGEVMDEQVLLKYSDRLGGLIIDVWNGEPDINLNLLNAADIATPHIAGYSFEGKINATTMVISSFAAHFGINELKDFDISDKEFEADADTATDAVRRELYFDYHESRRSNLARIFASSYNIFRDDFALRQNREQFEYQRTNYAFRGEFSDELIDFVSL